MEVWLQMQGGWDWARSTHSVAVTDERGQLVASWRLAHGEGELAATLQRLAGLCPPAELPVGIEARTGLIVERLLAAGHPVVAVHPNAFHAARPRWGASGAKSDAGDAIKLAEFVRTELDAEHATVRGVGADNAGDGPAAHLVPDPGRCPCRPGPAGRAVVGSLAGALRDV